MPAATRRLFAVIRATVLELCGEPFVFLTLLASLALAVLAPAFHYHQFGEPSRLARDAGFSAFLLGGSLAVVFGAIRSVRREIEGGTCEAALAHALSPAGFLAAKIAGFACVVAVFLLATFSVSLVMVDGVEVGAALAARAGGLARPWGPCLAIGVAVLVLPVLLAASLNRFAGWRFTLTATQLTWILAVIGAGIRGRTDLALRYAPVFLLAAVPMLLLVLCAGVLAFRHRANVAAAGTGLLAAAMLPALGNYCLAEVLANGGAVPIRYVLAACAAALPAFAALIVFGRFTLVRPGDPR